jgi:hypothetical protein
LADGLNHFIGKRPWIAMVFGKDCEQALEKSNLWILRWLLKILGTKSKQLVYVMRGHVNIGKSKDSSCKLPSILQEAAEEGKAAVIFIDDAIYSGTQMFANLRAFAESTLGKAPKGGTWKEQQSQRNQALKPMRIAVAAPYISDFATDSLTENWSSVLLLRVAAMSTLLSQLTAAEVKEVQPWPLSGSRIENIPILFPFKMSDLVSGFPDVYSGIVESCKQGNEPAVFPLIPRCEALYQHMIEEYADRPVERMKKQEKTPICPWPPYKTRVGTGIPAAKRSPLPTLVRQAKRSPTPKPVPKPRTKPGSLGSLSKAVQNLKARGIRCVVWDFDKTAISIDVLHGLPITKVGDLASEAKKLADQLTPDFVRLFRELEKEGDVRQAFASFQDDSDSHVKGPVFYLKGAGLIRRVLKAAHLDDKERCLIVAWEPRTFERASPYNSKLLHLQRIQACFDLAPNQLLLIDDNKRNIDNAKRNGFQTALVRGSSGFRFPDLD